MPGKLKKGHIDLHTHGLARYDTRTDNPEIILKLARLHQEKGASLIFPTIYPADICTMRRHMRAVAQAMTLTNVIGGVNLEGPFLNPARAGALDKGHFLKPSASTLNKLLEGFEDAVRIITMAPELPGALKLIEKCAARGIRVNMGHSDATCEQALDGKKAGARGITHLFNAMRPFHHREPGLAGFGLLDEDIYAEVIADGVHLAPEALKLIFRMKRPDRILLVSDSVKGGMGRPVLKKGRLMGGGKTIEECRPVLEGLGMEDRFIKLAGRENQLKYLGAG